MTCETLDVQVDLERGAGRFLVLSLDVTDEDVRFDEARLDRQGRKRLEEKTNRLPYRAVRGILRIAWKSSSDRDQCIADQCRRGRWNKIQKYKAMLENGTSPASGPIYLHPSIRNERANTALEIDGTRRQLAALEAGRNQVDAVVLVHDTRKDGGDIGCA